MDTCGQIKDNLLMNACGKAAASGTNIRVYLANFNDIAEITYDENNETVITGIKMKTGTRFYTMDSKANSTEGQSSYETGTYGGSFSHSVTLRAFTKDQEVKNFLDSLANARVVAIVENNEKGLGINDVVGGTKYEMYGADSGLILTELPFSTTFEDTVTYTATLSSDENSKEGSLPKSVWMSDLATTEAALDNLIKDA